MINPERWPVVSPELQAIDKLLTQELHALPPVPKNALSPPEKEVFELASQGMTVSESADARGVAASTVKTQRKSVFAKLNDNHLPRVLYRMLDSEVIGLNKSETDSPPDDFGFIYLGGIVLKGIILKTDPERLRVCTGGSFETIDRNTPAQLRSFWGVKRSVSLVRRVYEARLFVPRSELVLSSDQPMKLAPSRSGREIFFPAYEGKEIRFSFDDS